MVDTANNNTYGLNTNFNVSPYFDDFSKSKNFHRIIFKPSVAVQARELTQLQTILQNQIDQFGKHMFKEGSLVLDGNTFTNLQYHYVKISDKDTNNNTISFPDLIGQVIEGGTSGVQAEVLGYETGLVANSPDTNTLYIKYINSGSDNNTKRFIPGETLETLTTLITFDVLSIDHIPVGYGSSFSINSGVLFSKSHFIRFDAQSMILDKYSPTPTYRIGFEIREEIITSNDDLTLLDPASGSYNYAAPGADRLKLTAILTKVTDDTDVTAPNFVQLLRVNQGIIEQQITKTEYSIIRDELARRTYDESGNYVVRGFNVRVREHMNDGENFGRFTIEDGGNSSLLSIGVEAGKAYIYGYDVETLPTNYVEIEKGIDFKVVEQQNVTANYGNYVTVNECIGTWDVSAGGVLKLYDTAQTRITDTESSVVSMTGTQIGTARFKAIELASGVPGTPTAEYRLYLNELVMTGGSFSEVKAIYFDSPGADGTADTVLYSGLAYLEETDFNTSIYKFSTSNIRKLRDENNNIDTTFTFLKKFDVTVPTNGTFTVTTGTPNEIFTHSAGVLNSAQKFDYLLSFNAPATILGAGTVTVTAGSPSVIGTGTAFTNKFNSGDKILITATSEVYVITTVNSNTQLTLAKNVVTSSTASGYKKRYLTGDIQGFNSNGFAGTSRDITVDSSTSATFNMKETLESSVSASVIVPLSKVDAKEIRKILRTGRYVTIDISTNPGGVNGPWNLGISDIFQITEVRKKGSAFSAVTEGTDVTSAFYLDDGQRDNIYDHGRLKARSTGSVSLSDKLLVKLDYFAHDYSQGAGYFSVDSYPIDDINGAANTSAITTPEIPLYASVANGDYYYLRDSIDTRPSKVNTAADATLIGSVTTNPATTNNLNTSLGTLYTPKPNENFVVDFSYYLSRKDMIYITSRGEIDRIRGIPSINPATPIEPPDSMQIAVINVSPFPSLPGDVARAKNRPSYETTVKKTSIRRYTMKDIGALERRIENIEYYTALTMLEKDTADLNILDANGNDRFKNGIFVDPFLNHALGDLFDAGYRIAVDPKKAEIRPSFEINSIGLKPKTLTGVVLNKNTITLPYTHEVMFQQPAATTTRNAAGLWSNYVGILKLVPDTDDWVDTTKAPDLQIQDMASQQNYDNFVQLADAFGTQYGSWENVTGSKGGGKGDGKGGGKGGGDNKPKDTPKAASSGGGKGKGK